MNDRVPHRDYTRVPYLPPSAMKNLDTSDTEFLMRENANRIATMLHLGDLLREHGIGKRWARA